MLQPTNRLTLIDAMRPPVGFRIDSAMAVTFTLDLRALLAAPAAFALTGPDGLVADGSQQEPIELLHALRSHAGKITVFSQVGEIALPPSRKVFAFLERSVIPVRAPRGGLVHPKVWVLRYDGTDEPPVGAPRERRLRVLIASRNLTFDTSWDTVVRLDEATDGRGESLNEVGLLFEGLLDLADSEVSADHTDRVRSLSAALRSAAFALPTGVDEMHIHILGLARAAPPLPARAERSLIISPFVSDDFFARIRPSALDELVSRPESLDLLAPSSLAAVGSAHCFDDGSVSDGHSGEERLSTNDPGRPLVGLHAKVFAFENGDRAHIFLGSANATAAAFSRNVEILVELIGTTAELGIDRLCGGTDDEPGLRSLFYRYSGPSSVGVELPDIVNLDGARRAIASLRFDGLVEESGTEWAVTYRSHGPIPVVDEAEIRCWPLATAGNRRRVATGEPLDVRFETSLETISGFLAFEVAHGQSTVTSFVIPVPLSGVPEHRDRLLLRSLVGNFQRFLRYLLALLDEDPTEMGLLDGILSVKGASPTQEAAPANLPVLEKLLRTMRHDPSKLIGLHPLVTDLAADDALPPEFLELWTTIYRVAFAGGADR